MGVNLLHFPFTKRRREEMPVSVWAVFSLLITVVIWGLFSIGFYAGRAI
jgi:hypothetical protein